MIDISIIILNYKSKGFTLNAIKSIKEADFKNLKYEIIVVDNGSQDMIGDILKWQHPDVLFIQNKHNIGMGAGNNIGIKKALGEFIVIMNPDVIAFKETFAALYDYIHGQPDIGMLGPAQLNPDQSLQASCFRWYNLFTPFYRRTFLGKMKFAQKDLDRFLLKDYDRKKEKDVDWLLGSFLFCRKKALDEVGFFDERFFLYLEDTDLCKRFWQKKWRVVYYPPAKVVHNHIRQSAREPWYKFFTRNSLRTHILSWLRYVRKWGIK